MVKECNTAKDVSDVIMEATTTGCGTVNNEVDMTSYCTIAAIDHFYG